MLEAAQAEDAEITSIPRWTLHDLHRTAATGMQRLGFIAETVDACLIDDDKYLQHDFEANREKAFDAWTREVTRIISLA